MKKYEKPAFAALTFALNETIALCDDLYGVIPEELVGSEFPEPTTNGLVFSCFVES